MTTPVARKSILVIATETGVVEAIGAAMGANGAVRVDSQPTTLAGMNGRAIKALGDYDLILFQTSPDDEADLAAIRTLAEARRGGTVLVALADGNIPLSKARALSHAGVDEVLPLPRVAAEIEREVARLGRFADKAQGGAGHQGRIIAVAQARGGAGATTVAVNLADQLIGPKGLFRRKPQARVALVDLDLQFGTVGSFLDLPEQDTLLQLALDGTIPDANFVDQSMIRLPSGLSVLAAPAKFAPLDSLRPEQVAALLDVLRASHDYVVIDLPRALVGWIEPVVQRADQLIVVTDTAVSSIRHCRRLIDFFTQDNVALTVEVVVNHQARRFFRPALHREAARALERRLDHWLPHDPRAACAACDRGQPISAVAPRSPLGRAMARLARSTRDGFPVAAQQFAR